MIKKIFLSLNILLIFISAGILLVMFSLDDFVFLIEEAGTGQQFGVGQYFSVLLLLTVDCICAGWILFRMNSNRINSKEMLLCFVLEIIAGVYGYFWLTIITFMHVAIGLIYIKKCTEK